MKRLSLSVLVVLIVLVGLALALIAPAWSIPLVLSCLIVALVIGMAIYFSVTPDEKEPSETAPAPDGAVHYMTKTAEGRNYLIMFFSLVAVCTFFAPWLHLEVRQAAPIIRATAGVEATVFGFHIGAAGWAFAIFSFLTANLAAIKLISDKPVWPFMLMTSVVALGSIAVLSASHITALAYGSITGICAISVAFIFSLISFIHEAKKRHVEASSHEQNET